MEGGREGGRKKATGEAVCSLDVKYFTCKSHVHLQSAFFNDCFFLEGFEIT